MLLFNYSDGDVQSLRRGCIVFSDGTVQFAPTRLFNSCGRGVQSRPLYSERLENACKKALTFTPRPSYKNIQLILSTGQDKTKKSQQAETSSSDAYGFTRGADYYGGED
jgi:hypothetical protein